MLGRFGVRSSSQLRSDLAEVVRDGLGGDRFQFGTSSMGLLRPDLSLPAYAGRIPGDGLAPIFNLFDRVGGGRNFSQRVTRRTCRDFRGGRLSYDEHDGTDFVCPPRTPLVAAAPGHVVMIRDRFLRGGLTVALDHGGGRITHYTHCDEALREPGEFVDRGEPVALSGVTGLDLMQFFPWVPPHVHFMVWDRGLPVDPFQAEDEPDAAWHWHSTEPVAGPLDGDVEPEPSPVDLDAMRDVINACTDTAIRAEIEAVRSEPAQLAALLEDALHHDRQAFDTRVIDRPIRPAVTTNVPITLPLPSDRYRGFRFGDSPWSRPR